ncbi:MAG TPA: phosphate ABC transporter permease PstA [Aestuariivirga sp.]|nr:phosphate ABC transporter permease PstA [Aestuariivirga sp.]
MTDTFKRGDPKLIARRYRAKRRFRAYGAAALGFTALFLAILIADIAIKAWPAFFEHRAVLKIAVDPARVDAKDAVKGDFEGLVKDAFRAAFPAVTSRGDRKKLSGLLSVGAADDLRRMVVNDPGLAGTEVTAPVLLSANADLYLKGQQTGTARRPGGGTIEIAEAGEDYVLTGAIGGLATGEVVRVNGGALRITAAATGGLGAEALVRPETLDTAAAGQWDVLSFSIAESGRRISDREIVWLESLKDRGAIEKSIAWRFFTSGDSREPELAGIRGALVGSLLAVAVALALSLPLGVAAAIYLEQFAARNRLTEVIEVNINNLAAVPSIIFGLLGLAVFLNFFGLPRSAALAGGLVLALLVLPTIIIASRAALKSVPPSIAEAALGVGASHQQAVFHHMLPLAFPGILTGTILAVARALGETAPLLMIGMVAFIVDVPGNLTDAATVLPVQIFLWSDLPEIAFQSRTAAAIVLLLAVLFGLNAVAIYLRKRFERRW